VVTDPGKRKKALTAQKGGEVGMGNIKSKSTISGKRRGFPFGSGGEKNQKTGRFGGKKTRFQCRVAKKGFRHMRGKS